MTAVQPSPGRAAGRPGFPRHPIFTEEHDALRESVRRWVSEEITPHIDEWEDAGRFPDRLFHRAGELGFLGLHYDQRWGGAGGDLAATVVFTEELGRCGAGAIPMALGVQADMATPALAEFGSDDQRERWLRPMIAGELIAAIGITEPDAGSDVAGIRTRAIREGDDWVIDGAKLYITNGLRADVMTCVVKTDPAAGHRGISLILVPMDTPGVTVSRSLRKLGMRSSDTAEILLEDVRVPHENLIGGEPGEGFAQLMWQLQYERVSGGAACTGTAGWILEETFGYVRQRHAFGKPIGDHQALAHKLADAATELEAARQLLYGTVWRLQTAELRRQAGRGPAGGRSEPAEGRAGGGEYPVAEVSMVKKYCAQVQNRVVDTCLQAHGGAGFMHEFPVSRLYRDARLQRIGGGSDEIMNDIIAKRLGIRG